MRSLYKVLAMVLVGSFTAVGTQAQAAPDLIVSDAAVNTIQIGRSLFVDKVSVSVTNDCRAPAGAAYVLVTFKTGEASDAKAIFFIGNVVRALRGGQTATQVFDVRKENIPADMHIVIEVDPYKKVLEASEDNNWRTLNPSGRGMRLTSAQCVVRP